MTEDANLLPFPDRQYQIIYADPPWAYKDKCSAGCRGAHFKYPTQDKDWIKNLPVPSITDHNAALFLWVTMPLLDEGIEVLKAWGFAYKTVAFTWVKRNKIADSWFWGMGNWTRANPELCLLGIKGNIKRESRAVHSVIDARLDRHSKKPDVVRDRIEQLLGDLPRIELFAREQAPGWDSWGNEVG